jgi:hypothetical protein
LAGEELDDRIALGGGLWRLCQARQGRDDKGERKEGAACTYGREGLHDL